MPWATREKHRAYQKKYNKTPKQKRSQTLRKAARRKMIKEGKAAVGDGKDVAHKKSLKSGGTNARKNLKMESQKKNRGYPRGKPGQIKSRPKKRTVKKR